MKFKSPNPEPIHIALTSGHTAVIGKTFEELPAIFHREAVARGALIQGVKGQVVASMTPDNRKTLVKNAMQDMLDGNDPADFTQDGKPDTGAVSKRVGFTIDRDERDAIWGELSIEESGDKGSNASEEPPAS